MNVHFVKNIFPLKEKPQILAFDCHFHSRYSDGSAKVEKILRQAKKYNIGIAITDHNEIKGSVEAYRNKLDVPVIPGIEVSCKGMIHLLLYFYDPADLNGFYEKNIAPYKRLDPNASLKKMTALKVAKLARQYNCVVVLAHPYGGTHREIDSYLKRLGGNEEFFKYIDCIEINGTINQKRNQKAVQLAKKLHKPIIGGSDGHTLSPMGNIITIAKAKNYRDFLDQVRKGHTAISGKKARFYQRYMMASVISYKHIKATTKKHHKALLTSLGLYAVFQSLSIPLIFFLASVGYKKVRDRKKH